MKLKRTNYPCKRIFQIFKVRNSSSRFVRCNQSMISEKTYLFAQFECIRIRKQEKYEGNAIS